MASTGLKVSMLNSRASTQGSSPGQDIVLCSWARHLTLMAPLSTQVYNPAMDYLPMQGSKNTPSHFMLWKLG